MPTAVALLNYMKIRELDHTFADFFPKLDFFAGLVLYIREEHRKISEAAMRGAGCPVLRVNIHKTTSTYKGRQASSYVCTMALQDMKGCSASIHRIPSKDPYQLGRS